MWSCNPREMISAIPLAYDGDKKRMVASVSSTGNMQFFTLSAALILATLSTRSSADSLSDWSYTCKDYYLSNPVLYASCKQENGQYDNTNINLDKCVTNDNGVLYCGTK